MIETAHNSIVYTTYNEFARDVRRIAFPDGMSDRLRQSVENYIWVALIKAQKYIDLLRGIHVNFYFPDQLEAHCGVGRVLAPRGKINAVYAFTCDAQCNKAFYEHATAQRIDCWRQQNRCAWQKDQDLTDGWQLCYQAYPYVYPYGEVVEEEDARFLCNERLFAVDRSYRLYLAPRFPCQYILAVHWEGLRRSWNDSDLIAQDDDLLDWVAFETQAEVALRHDRNPKRHEMLQREADERFADLAWWANEERRVQARHECVHGLDQGTLTDIFLPIVMEHDVDAYQFSFLIDPFDRAFIVDPENNGRILIPR